jgi:homoserine O-acetyltransferase
MKPAPFESSDSVRHAKALRHAQTFTFAGPFRLELGGQLSSVTTVFETYGTLNAARDNAILICHAISGDSHVASHDAADDPGWWDIMVGPGKPIDTDHYFVVCPNLLGGCRGSTGPGSVNPETSKPYGRDFPTVTVGDMVAVQRRLLEHLGIGQLLAVVGGSMGGHQALTWATRHADQVRGVIALATSPRLTSQALAFDVVGRNAIMRDPHYHNGQYYDQPDRPEVGLALARMIGHITYLSREAMSQKFEADRLQPRDVAIEFEKKFSVGSYLGYQGQKFVERFDPNSYVALTMAMDLFDLGATPAELTRSLAPAQCRWLVLSFTSDWLFPAFQSRDLVDALIANEIPVTYCNVESSCGHDAFLLPDDLARYGELLRAFLANVSGTPLEDIEPHVPDGLGHAPTSIFHKRRVDYDRIVELIPPGASVLDLGCGRGGLLRRVKQHAHPRLLGIEWDEPAIITCVRRGVDVIHADLNKGLRAFADRQFDCVLLSQTLQAIADVEGALREMLRVGRTGIVSFPNLAYHKLRRMLAEEGRAPRTSGILGYEWYNTPNIRFLSITDFEDFCQAHRYRVHRRIALDTEADTEVFDDPNRNADLAIFVLSRH